MKITGWRIDGYGVHVDQRVSDLPTGMTAVFGPNEAGKSTLLAFIRQVLFGYPDRRRKERLYDALGGGRHGGALLLADDAGRPYVLERHVETRKAVLTLPDGSLGGEEELRVLLGEADAGLFSSVFAFGLSELASLDSLEADEVRDRVFSAGVLGAGRSAGTAIKALEQRRGEILRPRKDDAPANALQRRGEEIEARLRELRSESAGFSTVAQRLDVLDHELAASRQHGEALRRRVGELERLALSWPSLERLRRAEGELGTLAPGEDEELLLALHPELKALQAARSGDEARQTRLGELRRELGQLDHRAKELSLALAEAGGDGWWAHAASVGEDDLAAAEELGERCLAAIAARRETDLQLDTARAALSQVVADAPATGEEVPSSDCLASEALELTEARAWIAERDRLVSELSACEREARLTELAARRSGHPLLAMTPLVVLLAVVFAACGAWAMLRGAALAGGVTLLGAGALLVLAALAVRQRGAPTKAPETGGEPELRTRLDEANKAAQGLAERLGLEPVAMTALEARIRRHEEHQHQRRDLEQHARSHAAAAATFERLASRADELERDASSLEDAASALARRLGVPRTQPAALAILLRRLAHLQGLLAQRARLESERERIERSLLGYRSELETLADKLGARRVSDGDPLALLAELAGRSEQAAASSRRRAELSEHIVAARADLRRGLGADATAERLRDELECGAVLEWEVEQRRLETELTERGAQHDALVGERAELLAQREALLHSSEIAELELELSAVREDLTSRLREWAELGLARALLERALRRYEQERQPLVIRRAGELFSEVTAGRYDRLVAREQSDGGRSHGLDALRPSGARVDSGALSRGTAEQLYLCLRLALAATFAERSVRLPLVLDDVLVNFDPERARALAGALAKVATTHQVLVFTCHPHVVELLSEQVTGLRVVELGRGR